MDGENAQSVIKIRSKLAFRGHRFEVAMSSGYQSHIRPYRLAAPNSLEGLLLEQAKNLRLKRQRHVADFIEQDGPVVALFEFADAAAVGSRKGPFFVSE